MHKAGLLACGLVLVWAGWAMLSALHMGPLALYDEGTYAKVVSESIERGDFLTFTLWGTTWFEKPPLYFWLAGLATYITGSNVLGIRLPAALFGIATVALTMALTRRITGSYWAGALAGALLVLTPPFIQGAREARLDLLVVFFILLAYWAAFSRQYIWFGVAVALAVLSKSAVAVFAAAALPLWSLWSGEWGWLKDRRFWLGVGTSIIIIAPWHLYEWWHWHAEFWRQYIGHHVLARYETNLFIRPQLQTNYLARLSEQAKVLLAASFLSVVALPLYISALPGLKRAHILALLSLVVLMAGVFFSAQTRALSYLLPLYPLAALCVALCAWHICKKT